MLLRHPTVHENRWHIGLGTCGSAVHGLPVVDKWSAIEVKWRTPLNVLNVTGVWPNEAVCRARAKKTACVSLKRDVGLTEDRTSIVLQDHLTCQHRALQTCSWHESGFLQIWTLCKLCSRTVCENLTAADNDEIDRALEERETQKTITKRLRQVRKQRDEKVDEMRRRAKASAVASICKKKGKSQISSASATSSGGPSRWEPSAETLRAENHTRSMMGLT